MKKSMIAAALLFPTLAWFSACQKDTSPENGSPGNAALEAAKTTAIQKSEPVLFTMTHAGSDSVRWSVSPAANVQINSNGNKATVFFGKAGSYEVKAVSGSLQATSAVAVSDSVYKPVAANYSKVPLTGDQVNLSVSRIDSGGISGLLITAVTTNSYNCLNSYLQSDLDSSRGGYAINYSGINIPGSTGCTAGQAKAGSFLYLYPVADGSHPFKVTLNGTTYAGSFVKSDRSYTISWPYTNGVTVSPLVIK